MRIFRKLEALATELRQISILIETGEKGSEKVSSPHIYRFYFIRMFSINRLLLPDLLFIRMGRMSFQNRPLQGCWREKIKELALR